MFLTKQDLDASIYPEIVSMIARYSDAIINMHIATAVSEIETMLGGRYDIKPVLAKTGADRHTYLLSLARDMAIYHMYAPQETIPAHRVKRYDQAIAMLELIQQGKSTLPGVDLAPIPENPTVAGQIGWGSGTPRPRWE
jgi:phage gp36-like protein